MNRGTRGKLKEISDKLSEILQDDSSEQVMVFTDDKVLMELCGQINLLLLDRQQMKANFRRQEQSSRKMLANISHDIKTPLTVILGYLEIMRLKNTPDLPGGLEDEMLQKVETKAKQVMELIDQFFTLAKLEAGDKRIEMVKVNISELCRENVLGFYELLMQKDFEVELSIPEQAVFVMGDRDAIDRILCNLLSNAIAMAAMGTISEYFCGKRAIMSASMWWTKEKASRSSLPPACSSGSIRWRIPAAAVYRETVWDSPSPEISQTRWAAMSRL